jgi:hypothetical protein
MRNIWDKTCTGNNSTYFMINNFFQKSCHFLDYVEHVVEEDNIIRCMHFSCYIAKATDTHTHTHTHRILLFGNNGYTQSPQSFYIRKLPLLLLMVDFPVAETSFLLSRKLHTIGTNFNPKYYSI